MKVYIALFAFALLITVGYFMQFNCTEAYAFEYGDRVLARKSSRSGTVVDYRTMSCGGFSMVDCGVVFVQWDGAPPMPVEAFSRDSDSFWYYAIQDTELVKV